MLHNRLSRRQVMAGTAGISAATILHWAANAAEFSSQAGLVVADGTPGDGARPDRRQQDQTGNQRTAGDHHLPEVVLGGDTAMIAQVISGALEMYQSADRSAGAAQPGLWYSRRRLCLPGHRSCLGRHGWRSRQLPARCGGTDRALLPGQGLTTTASARSPRGPSRSPAPTTCMASRSDCRWRRTSFRCSATLARHRPRSTSMRFTAHCRPASWTARKTHWC